VDQILDVAMSIGVLLIGGLTALIMIGLNYLGERLWKIQRIRKVLNFLESIKQVFPPIIGFGLAWIPWIPVPEALAGEHRGLFALVGLIAGALWREVYMLFKTKAKQRGIDIQLDLPPKKQREALRPYRESRKQPTS
jgi:hypothetical protein